MLSFSSIHTDPHALILLPNPHALGIWVHTWLVMLSPAVMRVVQVFHLCDVRYGLCLWDSVVVFHPSRCELAVVRIDDVV
jgi:hypothetical protein